MHSTYHGRQTRIGYVWRPALFYALSYTVFALAVKLSSDGAKAAPAVFTTLFCVGALPPILMAIHSGMRRRRQRNGPEIRWSVANFVSGLATIVIVATTAGAYLVDGVTILLALLLMRMGVIMMAPVLDLAFRRHVRPTAWFAFSFCLIAAMYGLLGQTFAPLKPVSIGILAAYLIAYAVRLSLMTRQTKDRDRAARGDWFLVEMVITAVALSIVAVGAILASTQAVQLDISLSDLPPLVAGVAYGYALVNGTLIYLDWRENAYSITINRSASLISGLAASLIGFAFFDLGWPASDQWVLACLMACALVALGFETRSTKRRPET